MGTMLELVIGAANRLTIRASEPLTGGTTILRYAAAVA